jgi:hypothetical protein
LWPASGDPDSDTFVVEGRHGAMRLIWKDGVSTHEVIYQDRAAER